MATKNLSEYNAAKVPDASNMIFGIVVSEWNPEITGALLDGCVSTLEKHGALPENIHVKTVPGSFELIYGARQMTLNDGYDAVIVLGCVIRGETPHFDYICQGVTQGIARLNATNNIPVVYGLLTTENMQQAQDRAGGRLAKKETTMKRTILSALMLVCGLMLAIAQNPAQIKFDKTTHNFGTFSEANPVVSCVFTFTNVGEQPLVVNQAIASCGCTVPEYTKEPIKPGEKGEIKVTYNGEGKFPGHFKKSITVRTNGAVEMTRLYIEGDMTEAEKK